MLEIPVEKKIESIEVTAEDGLRANLRVEAGVAGEEICCVFALQKKLLKEVKSFLAIDCRHKFL